MILGLQPFQLVAVLVLAMYVVPLALALMWLQGRVALVFVALAAASLVSIFGASRDVTSYVSLPGRVGVVLLGLRLITLERRRHRG